MKVGIAPMKYTAENNKVYRTFQVLHDSLVFDQWNMPSVISLKLLGYFHSLDVLDSRKPMIRFGWLYVLLSIRVRSVQSLNY